MGLLKKEVKRPMQEIGKDNCIQWYQDDNSLFMQSDEIHRMAESYNQTTICEMEVGLNVGIGSVPIEKLIKEILLTKIPNLIEYFLVYIDLPETVEGLVISKIKEFKRQQGVILDKINQKRKKLL
jgi:hypothetical protein